MGRSSSSRRKKRSKNSSQARARKRSKISSTRYESKKLRRHVYDDDDSRSSMSGSSYSSGSEDSKYRSKKSRVRIRKHVVSNKKKARRHSYSSESSEDSHRARKRTGSKRKRDYKNNNKKYSKKKHRRDNSVSSTSSGSRSCPTCQSDSISSHDVEFERHRRKHGKEERDERNLEKVERATKMSRYRSTSPLCSECSESSEYRTEQKVSVENNSRRLRSIITVAERDKEDRELSRDEHKEQIVYDHDDYPSSRSNDSNDTGRQREEVDNYPHIEREKKIRLENEKGGDTVVSDFRIPKNADSGNVSDKDVGDQCDGTKSCSDEFGKANTVSEKTSEVSGSISGVNTDDLESVLRQRALENLRRFRGGLQTNGCTVDNQKGKDDGDTEQSPVANAELVQIKSSVEDDTKLVGANSTKEDGAKVVVSTETHLAKGVRVPELRKDTGANESVSPKQNIAGSINKTMVAGNSKEDVKVGILALRPKLVRPVFTRQLSKTDCTLKQAPGQQEPRSELLVTKGSSEETYAVTAPTAIKNINNNSVDVNNVGSSTALEPCSLKSTSGETSSDKLQDEANEGSQFQEKTMSVMRGGEMVQVSYKVYIPKKVPALARRQLKR